MSEVTQKIGIHNTWKAVCIGPDGLVKWEDGFENVVPMFARAYMVNAAFGSTSSSVWYVGLKSSGAPSTADTLASHVGWAECLPGTTDRIAFTKSTATSDTVTNSGAVAAFAITASTNVSGAFLVNQITSSSDGILFGVGNFAAERSVLSGDTLNVTVSCQITSST